LPTTIADNVVIASTDVARQHSQGKWRDAYDLPSLVIIFIVASSLEAGGGRPGCTPHAWDDVLHDDLLEVAPRRWAIVVVVIAPIVVALGTRVPPPPKLMSSSGIQLLSRPRLFSRRS